MRNLKRVLALAMALVMILGMMVIGSSAAAYSDESAIDAKYADAVEILTGMGVFKGTGTGFGPKQILDRASAAALVYRVITGDVKDKQVDLYDYSSFADVAEGVWYTPYITYAANGGYLKGFNGNAMPNDTVTGIQVLAMMLRAAGYGQNGEFEGAAWKDGILTTAKELGITKGISTNDLDKGASRELVAQLLFNAITGAKIVAYSPILNDYIPVTIATDKVTGVVTGMKSTQTLGEKVFGLTYADGEDIWGRPGVVWFDGRKGQPYGYYATIEEEAAAKYTVAVSDCQLAIDLGLKASTDVELWINGYETKAPINIYSQAKNSTENGGQGVQIEVYADRIVRIDTYLAEVGTVYPEKADRLGHVYEEAYSDVDVICTDITETTMESVDYKKGDMILVNVNHTYGVLPVQVADAIVGAQTTHFWNSDKHEINDVIYADAEHFHMDPAGAQAGNWTWYLDQFGNIIGDAAIVDPSAYGVIKSIQWINIEDNNGYAKAYIVDMNGETSVMQVVSIDGKATAYNALGADNTSSLTEAYISTNLKENYAVYCAADLYEIKTVKGGVALTHVVDGLALAEVTDATVKTAVPVITGTPKDVLVDNDTKYLIRVANVTAPGGYTWTTAVGYENVATYTDSLTNDVTVDYVNLDKDVIAEYVYITGKADSTTAYDYVYITNNWDIAGTLKVIGNYQYYTVTGVVRADGNTDPLYVLAYDAKTNTGVKVTDLLTWMSGNVDKLFVVKTVDGKAQTLADLVIVTEDKTATTQNGNVYAYYAGSVATIGNGMIVTVDGAKWNVNTTTTVANVNGKGTISDLTAAKLAGKYVYVVGYNYGNTNIAKAVFITSVVGTTTDDLALAAAKTTAIKAMTDYVAAIASNNGAFKDVTAADMAATLAELTAKVNAAKTEAEIAAVNGVTALHNAGLEIQAAKDLVASADLVIKTAAELKAFAAKVNAGDTFSGKTVVLAANIDLKGEAWTPIGNATNKFLGTFDGQNYTIKNLNVTGTTNVGLFGVIFNGAVIKNVTIDGAVVKGNQSAAALVGGSSYCTIENCTVKNATISLTPVWTGNEFDNGDDAGAIVGIANTQTIVKDCYAENIVINAYRDVGGIVGTASTSSTGSVTGCSAKNVTVNIDQVTNSYGKKDVNADGIVGRVSGSITLSDNEYVGTFVPNLTLPTV